MKEKISKEKMKKIMYTVGVGLVLLLVVVGVLVIRKVRKEEELLRQEEARREIWEFNMLGDVEDALRVGEEQKAILEKYPWYYDLPIEGKYFTVVWDWEPEKFRIDLKMSRDTKQDTIDIVLNQAIGEIKKLTGSKIGPDDYYVLYMP